MNKKYLLASIFLSAGMIILALAINYASAQSGVEYPIKELDNCANETACATYCDKPSNIEACLNFAKQHSLMPKEEIERAEKFLAAGSGPGGCKTKDTCESYCNSVERIDECVAYAEKSGLMSPQELEEAKKIQAAKNRGVKMPACGSKKQCDTYCSEIDHMEECINFAQEAGFMSAQELEESKKVLAAIKAGAKLPDCKGKEACDVYCSEEEHFNSCMEFALAAGFMDPKDAEMAKKTKGKGPGGCRGKEQCDAFCQGEGNMEICAQFGYENGMITKEEFEMMKKTKGKGPGGCKTKEECQSFCDNPDNQETCFNFGKENGLIPEADLQRMEQGKQKFKQAMQNIPPEVYSCLESAVGAEVMAKYKSGEVMPSKEIGDKMGGCFQQNMKQKGPGGPGEGGSIPPADGSTPGNIPGTTGPGGCTGQEECQNYCESNQGECQNFKSPPPSGSGGGPGSGSMPPCEGGNCPPPPSMPGLRGGPVPAPMPCGGGNCPSSFSPGSEQYRPPESGQYPMQPGQQNPPEGGMMPPPPTGTAPGSGGGTQPGVFVPQFEPTPQMIPTPPQEFVPPPPSSEPAPPTSSGNLNNLLGAVVNPFIEFLFGN